MSDQGYYKNTWSDGSLKILNLNSCHQKTVTL